jgi:hypothetical protein
MNRKKYFILFLLTIFLGLSSRKFSIILPEVINLYLGDALWALMVYWLIRLIKPSFKILITTFLALQFSFTIEISQLYHADWIDSIRKTFLGGLILGFGFLWSDILAYTIGILVGVFLDMIFINSFKVVN